jgi:ATP synthase protein I
VNHFTKLTILVGGRHAKEPRLCVGLGMGRGRLVQPAVSARGGEMAKKNRSFPFSRSAKSLQENASNAGAAAGASYTLVGAIILLGGIGYAVDRWQGSAPWGLLIGLMLGIVVGFYELVKTFRPR